jgi:Tfp pilus assembly protein PilN
MRGYASINLASEPFRRDRPALVIGLVFLAALGGLLGFQAHLILTGREALAESRAAVETVDRQVAALTAEQARLEGQLRRAENAEVLDRSLFLNSLLVRKGVSWTMIFSDLEKVIPHNVRLVAIRPHLDADNRIQLEMTVGAQSPEPVIEMLMKLEGSPRFGPPSIGNSLPPTQSEPLHRFRIHVNYAQEL